MKELIINTTIQVYTNEIELDQKDTELVLAARNGLANSYSPYSNFKVSAALHLENGQTITGANQENAAYPLCLCAERVALSAASSQHPGVIIKTIAVTAKNLKGNLDAPVSPCGSCRQVIVEWEYRQQADIKIILQGQSGEVYVFNSAKALLPLSFNPEVL